MTASKPKLRWFQYSLRSLLVFVTLCAIPCSWLAVKMQQAKRQREAVAAIEKLGGAVFYDWGFDANGGFTSNGQPPGPAWLRNLLGEDFFQQVKFLTLYDCTFTDAGLEHLRGLNQLETLWLEGTQVTDAGLEHLKGLNQLQELWLGKTPITDSGLENLKGLSQLQRLLLSDTQVTDAGLENLKGLNQLRALDLQGTKVSDVGLEHLKGLKQLEGLDLGETQVTEEGVRDLQKALPNCRIYH